MGERLVGLLHARALVLMLLVGAIGLGVGVAAKNIAVDNSLDVWFVEGDPALEAYDRYKQSFGNDETIVVAIVDPKGVYRPSTLERIRKASDEIDALPGVRRVTSITKGLHVHGVDGGLMVEKLLGDGPVTEIEAAAVKERVAMNPSFRGVIVTDSDTITLLLVDPKHSENFEKERAALIDRVTAISTRELTTGDSGLELHFGGIGVVYEGLNKASIRDSGIFITLSYLVIFIGLWVMFRRIVWVLVGAGIVTLANIATLGVAGLAGRDMNMVTAVLPTLIMTIGILDLVHLIDGFEQGAARGEGQTRRQLMVGSLSVVVITCVFNSITDMFGFLALTSAKMAAVRDLGWLAAVGLGFLALCVLVFGVPAIARWGGRGRRAAVGDKSWLRKVVLALYGVARDRRGLVLAATLGLIALSAAGIARLDVDTYTIGFLSEDDPVRRDHHAIEQQFGPYIPLEMTVRTSADGCAPPSEGSAAAAATTAPPVAEPSTVEAEQTIVMGEDDLVLRPVRQAQGQDAREIEPEPDSAAAPGLKDPDVLARLDRLERSFEADPRVARATGLPEVVKRVNQIMNEERPEAYAVPEKPGVVAEELFNYGLEADGRDHLDDLVTPNYECTHVTSRTGLPTARGIQSIVEDLHARGRAAMGSTAEVEPAGYLPLYVRIIHHITDAQVRSFSISLFLVTLVMMLLLRSVRLGAIAMVPNLLPAAMTLGLMGWVGIRLDVATVLIAAIAIGISVNDTSHIMFRFRHELARTPGDPEDAVRRMLLHTGRAVVASSVILIAGFGVLLFASVKSVSYFGLLSSMTILSALLADLIITPALLLSFGRRR
ncbi:MAG TPA: MMPL family transporter [Kofleriaceae bacterium]|nr:MMPL family transporter [Kofleriaceae bacterium]